MPSVTLKDIAERAGVSVNTVSAALAGRGRIGPETSRRILALAAEMHYVPNVAARQLRNKFSVDVGLLMADRQTMVVPPFLKWCEREQLRHQLELISSADPGIPAMLAGRSAAGVLHIGAIGDGIRRFLAEFPAYPLVAISEPAPYCVLTDFICGGRDVVRHLAGLGRRRIQASFADADYEIYRELYAGVMQAGHECAVEIAAQHFVLKNLPTGTIMAMMLANAREKLRRQPRPDAWFCCGMIEARAVIQAALELGLRVPEELAVAAVGGEEEAEGAWPPVTTLGRDYDRLLELAMKLLGKRIRGCDIAPCTVCSGAVLQIRNSSMAEE